MDIWTNKLWVLCKIPIRSSILFGLFPTEGMPGWLGGKPCGIWLFSATLTNTMINTTTPPSIGLYAAIVADKKIKTLWKVVKLINKRNDYVATSNMIEINHSDIEIYWITCTVGNVRGGEW